MFTSATYMTFMGAVAQLVKVPVSLTGDPEFKSQQYLFIVHIGGEGQRGGHSGFLTNGFRELEMT